MVRRRRLQQPINGLGIIEELLPEGATALLSKEALEKKLTELTNETVAKNVLPMGKLVFSGFMSRLAVVAFFMVFFPNSKVAQRGF
jgi:hypothetical protein